MSYNTSKGPFTCRACKETYPTKGAYRNHARFSKTCTPEMRFWAKVDKNGAGGCWLWLGAKNERGYGLLATAGQHNKRAHRYSYELVHGPLKSEQFCLHHCDIRNCVNPEHMYVGSYQENTDDMIRRGRDRMRGEQNAKAKLTEEQVLELRRLRKEDPKTWTSTKLGARYGILPASAVTIWLRRTWKNLP